MALRDPHILDDTLSVAERRTVDGFVRELKEHYGERLQRVAIYGSRARGDVSEDSDIDVLIVLRIPPDAESRERSAIHDMVARAQVSERDVHVPISPAVFSLERFGELRDRERRFALDAEKEGIRL